MVHNRWKSDQREPSSTKTPAVDGQAVIALPEREVLTTLFSTSMFPAVTQTMPVDQTTTGGTNPVGDTTTTTTTLANSTAQSAPTQNGALAQNVNSPGATSYATQTQYAPVTKS